MNKHMPYLQNFELFFSRSYCPHAFLQERSKKYFQNELLESIRQTISLARLVLRGRAQKDVLEETMSVRRKCLKRRRTKFPRQNFLNHLMSVYQKKYTGEATMCWSTLLYFLKSNSFTTKTNLFRLFSAGLIEKKIKE